ENKTGMNLNLNNKNALVSGSTAGIGKAIAIQLAKQGANVTLLARDEEKLKKTLAELSKTGNQNHSYIVADFAEPEVLKSKIKEAVKNTTYHILINNTGGPKVVQLFDATTNEFE